MLPPGTGKVVCPPVEFPDPKCGEVPVPVPVPVVPVLGPHWPATGICPFEHVHWPMPLRLVPATGHAGYTQLPPLSLTFPPVQAGACGPRPWLPELEPMGIEQAATPGGQVLEVLVVPPFVLPEEVVNEDVPLLLPLPLVDVVMPVPVFALDVLPPDEVGTVHPIPPAGAGPVQLFGFPGTNVLPVVEPELEPVLEPVPVAVPVFPPCTVSVPPFPRLLWEEVPVPFPSMDVGFLLEFVPCEPAP